MRRWLHTQTADCRRWTIDLNRRLSGHKWSIIDCQESGFKNPVSRFPEPPRQSAECRALHCSVWWHRSHCVQMISSTHTSHYTTQQAKTLMSNLCNIFCNPINLILILWIFQLQWGGPCSEKEMHNVVMLNINIFHRDSKKNNVCYVFCFIKSNIV